MITEDYVSFEVAKLLKEKGFNEFTYSYYSKDDEESEPELCMENLCSDNWNGTPDEVNDLWFSAPTLQMAMKWLREVYNIHIEIRYNRYANTYHYKIIYGPTELDDYVSKPHELRTYEEAAEESIKHCLENLENMI